MRIWLNRTSEVSLREQLFMQIRLGILCGELHAGDRLPSTRELARRFGIHANTASAAFRELERIGWLEFRHGSGVFVSATIPAVALTPELTALRDARLKARAEIDAMDQLIGAMLSQSRELRLSPELVRERLTQWLSMKPPARWLVIEPEPELRRILIFELQQHLKLPIDGCSLEELTTGDITVAHDAMTLAIPNRIEAVRRLLPPELPLVTLQLHPVAPAIESYLPYPEGSDRCRLALERISAHRAAHAARRGHSCGKPSRSRRKAAGMEPRPRASVGRCLRHPHRAQVA
jgi:DNA-binding transcriptional regulator YhcF (GntR family)